MKKILLLGSSGFLGSRFSIDLERTKYNLLKPSKSQLKDKMVNYNNLKEFLSYNSVSYVINCIALNGVNNCYEDKKLAYQINSLFPTILSNCCEELGIHLLHFSTEMVFQDSITPIDINAKPNPSTFYGITKYFGECQEYSNTLIRLPLLISTFPNQQIVWKLLLRLKENKPIYVATDVLSTPVFVEDLTKSISKLIGFDELPFGLIHYSSNKRISLYETVELLAHKLNISTSSLSSCLSNDFPSVERKSLNLGLESSHDFSYLKLN